MAKEIKLDLIRIQEVINNIKNESMTKDELKEALGGERLDEIFDYFGVNGLLDCMIEYGKVHDLLEVGDGLDILEGLLNNKVSGDLSNFFCFNPSYILQLPPKERINLAKSFSAGRDGLEKALLNLWNRGIETEACSTNEKENDPMIQFVIGARNFEQQDYIQQLYDMGDIQARVEYDSDEDEHFGVRLKGINLYKYLQPDFSFKRINR